MAVPGSTTGQGSTASGSASPVGSARPVGSAGTVARHHGFHEVRVVRMVPETADASSLVLDVPGELRDDFAYEAGQFCTFRLVVDGEPLLRCYSMSSTPAVDDEFRVTVKRVPGGAVSNWLLDRVDVGDLLEVTPPAGVFTLAPDESELVAFAGGSGITPVFSLLKAALASTPRRVRLLYANRDADSVIFDAELAALLARHADQLDVVHHLDVEDGYVDADGVRTFLGSTAADAGYYLCGPAPFMDVVESALLGAGVDADRIHVERFTPPDPDVDTEVPLDEPDDNDSRPDVARVTIELDGRTETTDHHPGTTLLQTARQVGMSAPSSCESGSCATCMARLVAGSVKMHVNNALTDDEVEAGWVLTCQAVPMPPAVHVVYGFEGA
jgi:3-ketosteroid 9alpha-monooxygenase subunit B